MSLFEIDAYADGSRDKRGILWCLSSPSEVNRLLATEHYLGERDSGQLVFAGIDDVLGEVVAAQIWGAPSSRRLPSDGTWLELARWCLTPKAGKDAGSRQHGQVVKWIRTNRPEITTLVSYSDPSQGHTGSLYRACNWEWWPTWHRLAPPPTGNGRWTAGSDIESVKDRWVFPLRDDPRRDEILPVVGYASRRTIRIAMARDDLHPWQRAALSSQLDRLEK